jgi:hypothetical protein
MGIQHLGDHRLQSGQLGPEIGVVGTFHVVTK